MSRFSVAELIPVLQTAIGPVILISGIGLLLLTMTNRLGRVIDRARLLDAQFVDLLGPQRERKAAQLSVLWRRARILQLAITLSSTSALCAAILIVVIFLTALLQHENPWLISVLFILCVTFLIVSLVLFIHDINQSLAALKLELEDTEQNQN
jgi:hypothetical protein